MPTLSLPDGATLAWDTAPTPAEAPAVVSPLAVSAPDPDPEPVAPSEADVATALATPPPKWVATFTRFAKATAAALAVTFAAYGGDVHKMLADPVGVFVALGTGLVMGAEKFIHWKD